MSQLQENEERKDGDYAKGIQEKEQEIIKLKRDILLANERILKKESEAEEQRKLLSLIKGNLDRCNT